MKTKTPYSNPETYLFLLAVVLVTILSFLVFLPFLPTLILAATFAVVIYPIHKKVLRFCRGRKTLASFVTLISLIVLIIVPLFLITAQVFNETTSAYYHMASKETTLSLTLDTIQSKINSKIESVFPGVTIDIRNYITSASEWALSNMGNFFSSTISIGLNLFLGIFALFYFIKDGKKFMDLFQDITPFPREHTDLLIKKLRGSIRSIIGGSIVVAFCQGVASGIGYAIFGLPNPALWGVVTGLAALVPGLGTSIMLVPAIIYIFITGTLFQGIGMSLWGLLGVGLIDNFLAPKLIGGGLNIHPLIVLFSIIGGLSFFGPEGFLLGPLTLSLLFALFQIFRLIINKEEKIINE
ncbi:MAG: AI-2E family transporter [Candidatus Paceibacterota bacterium]|jgi:predicted PurR-regulated permease PerM